MRIRHLLGAAAVAATFGITLGTTAAGAQPVRPADQHGYDAVVCHTDTAYIYQYEDTSSARLDALPRGAHFQVYATDGGWDFGVRNYNSVSGHVLGSQLCAAGGSAATSAPATSAPATSAPATSAPATSAPLAASTPGGVVPNDVVGTRMCVRSSTLYVRDYPAGRAFDQLYEGQTFSVYEFRDSGWARGYAFGHVNTDRSGEAAPNDNVWTQTQFLTAAPAGGCPG